MPVRVDVCGEHICIDVDGKRVSVTKPQALILVRKIAKVLGLRVTTRKPILSYRITTGFLVADVIEGAGSRVARVPLKALKAYEDVVASLRPGSYHKRDFARMAFLRMRELGLDVSNYLSPDGTLDWERLIGNRDDFYALFRVPVLILEERGLIETTQRHVKINPHRQG